MLSAREKWAACGHESPDPWPCPFCKIAGLEAKLDDALRHLSIERQAYNDLARLRTEAESRLAAVIKERDEFGRLCKDSQGFADSVVKRLNAAESRLDEAIELLRHARDAEGSFTRKSIDDFIAGAVERPTQVIEVNLCGKPSPNGLRLCDLEAGHPGEHRQAFAVWSE